MSSAKGYYRGTDQQKSLLRLVRSIHLRPQDASRGRHPLTNVFDTTNSGLLWYIHHMCKFNLYSRLMNPASSYFEQAFSDLSLADLTERDASLAPSRRRRLLLTAATLVFTPKMDALCVTRVVPRRLLKPTEQGTVSCRPTKRRRSCALLGSDSATSALGGVQVTLDPIISDLKTRIASAPQGLQGDEESRLQAKEDSTLSRLLFEADGDGNLLGEPEQEDRLAQALSHATMVVVRVACPRASAALSRLNSAADTLLGETLSVDDKLATFGPMRDYERGVVTGYAGGGDYGSDQFLETRGRGPGTLVPEMDAETTMLVIEGRVRDAVRDVEP